MVEPSSIFFFDTEISFTPEWILAGTSILALMSAVTAALLAYLVYRRESRRDVISNAERNARDDTQRRQQASRVSVWFSDSSDADAEPAVYARNASDTPVYHVNLSIQDDENGSVQTRSLVVLPPSAQPVLVWKPFIGRESSTADRSLGVRVQMSFTDAAGVRWQRNRHGQLDQLASNLRIWSAGDMANIMSVFASDFRSSYGLSVAFDPNVAWKNLRNAFVDSVNDNLEGPSVDVLVGPHDWLGELLVSQGLAEIQGTNFSPTASHFLVAKAHEALSHGGRQYGIPASLDTVVLLRNAALAPDPPMTIEAMLALGETLVRSGKTVRPLSMGVGRHGDPFLIWPLFSSGGGWLFGKDEAGNWDCGSIGLNTEESIEGFRLLSSLGRAGARVLDSSLDQQKARTDFYRGRSPFLIDTFGALSPDLQTGIDVAFSGVPRFTDHFEPQSFYSVNAFYVASRGHNRRIAEDFIPHYLEEADVANSLSIGLNQVVIRKGELVAANKAAEFDQELCEKGILMPTFPEMPQVWKVLGLAEVQAARGVDPTVIAHTAQAEVLKIFDSTRRIHNM